MVQNSELQKVKVVNHWTFKEDENLFRIISIHGQNCWRNVPRLMKTESRSVIACRARYDKIKVFEITKTNQIKEYLTM